MLKQALAFSVAAALLASPALAAGPESDDATQLQDLVLTAQGTLTSLKSKFKGMPGFKFQGEEDQTVIVDVGATANAADKDILEKQLPRIEDFLLIAAVKFGDASLKLPANEGVTIFFQGCAETLRAQRQVTVAQGKAKNSLNFKAGDFSLILSDIERALADSKCR